MRTTTPRRLGYRWPAEWEPQRAVWMVWPHDPAQWPGDYAEIPPAYALLVAEISRLERVELLVANADVQRAASRFLTEAGAVSERIRFHHLANDDAWARDSGPVFVVNSDGLALVGFRFNAWGEKFRPFDADAQVAAGVARILDLPLFDAGIVLEGGALEGNGAGLALTTEECLLDSGRNAGFAKRDYEQVLSDYLGVKTVVWLGRGLVNDHTDGHIDNVARFISARAVVVSMPRDPSDPNFERCKENRERLLAATDVAGRPLEVVDLPLPEGVEFGGERLAASYANFIFVDGGERKRVLLPAYRGPNDRLAAEILARHLPDYEVVLVPADVLVRGGGAFHCLTQQEPATKRPAT